ncbi:nucleotidyl transferase AbiEii/AbiGii toxin family protein [Nocardia wallacei]|nr:nucleotidyl transferase AbiEii/AbiGii toxin family protein [Nocardia wallacei]
MRRPQAEVLRQFYMQRFLARVFIKPGTSWILKGGTGLLVRLPGARHSEDVDLLHLEADFEDAFNELNRLVSAPTDLDPLTFQLARKGREQQSGMTVLKLRATAYHGVKRLHVFPIDLTSRRELVGEIDHVQPAQVIEIPDIAAPPQFACYPLADQIADKLAAMYEYHGEQRTPSTRWRDLADLLLLIREFEIDASRILAALAKQLERRPGLQLPTAVHSPGPQWVSAYRDIAGTTSLPQELHTLEAALELLGDCVNPLLDGTVTTGIWDPAAGSWADRKDWPCSGI